MKILLIDDHTLFRAGLRLLLADLAIDPEFAEASRCEEAVRLAQTQAFALILLDYHLPDLSGVDALRAVRESCESAMVVVMSGEDRPDRIRGAIEHGAAGFIPKASSHAVMLAALRLVLAGGIYLPPHALIEACPTQPDGGPGTPAALDDLTDRQADTLRLAMQGKSNKFIARQLGVSEGTVKAHLSVAFRVLGVRNRTEAVFACARRGRPR